MIEIEPILVRKQFIAQLVKYAVFEVQRVEYAFHVPVQNDVAEVEDYSARLMRQYFQSD